jgi:hypothetical protein
MKNYLQKCSAFLLCFCLVLSLKNVQAQYPNAYLTDISRGYFDGHTFATFSSPVPFNTNGPAIGNLGGNNFTLTFTNTANLSDGYTNFESQPLPGARITQDNYVADMTAVNGQPLSGRATWISLLYRGLPILNDSYATVTFENNLDVLDHIIVAEVDFNEVVQLEFLDAAGFPLDVNINVRYGHLTNDDAGATAPLSYPSSTQVAINESPVTISSGIANEGHAFVMRTNNVRSIRIRQTGNTNYTRTGNWAFTLSKGAPDRGDAPSTYGDAQTLAFGNLLRLGALGADSESAALHSSNATGDNTSRTNDEDGVNVITPIINNGMTGQPISSYSVTTTVTNRSGFDANMMAWIDWNGNGTFDIEEAASASIVPSGNPDAIRTFTWNNITLSGANGSPGTFLRIWTSTNTLTSSKPSGFLDGIGEIEDYFVPFDIPLPVSWLYFNANYSEHNVLLSWATASELNNNKFEIERSTGTGPFNPIGSVKTASEGGIAKQETKYTFTDSKPNPGINYYRIKQVDIDSKYQYSRIRSVKTEEGDRKIVVFPNPSADYITISGLTKGQKISIYNNTGQLVIYQTSEDETHTINLKSLLSSTYQVVITDLFNQTIATRKLVTIIK